MGPYKQNENIWFENRRRKFQILVWCRLHTFLLVRFLKSTTLLCVFRMFLLKKGRKALFQCVQHIYEKREESEAGSRSGSVHLKNMRIRIRFRIPNAGIWKVKGLGGENTRLSGLVSAACQFIRPSFPAGTALFVHCPPPLPPASNHGLSFRFFLPLMLHSMYSYHRPSWILRHACTLRVIIFFRQL